MPKDKTFEEKQLDIQKKALGIQDVYVPPTITELGEKYKDYIKETNETGLEEFFVGHIEDQTSVGEEGHVMMNEIRFNYVIGDDNKFKDLNPEAYAIGFRRWPKDIHEQIMWIAGKMETRRKSASEVKREVEALNDHEKDEIKAYLDTASAAGAVQQGAGK